MMIIRKLFALLKNRMFPKSLIERLRENPKDIVERKFGNVSSFNFSRRVFKDGRWNDVNVKARGLFLDTRDGRIVARGYDKFFAYREGEFNSPEWLKDNLSFPVRCYRKYNGFLGILGFDEDGLLFCSKSMVGGKYSEYFKDIFRKQRFREDLILGFMRKFNVGMVFEVIDPENDPHIVGYDRKQIVLLDVVKLDEQFTNLDYETLKEVAYTFDFCVKKKVREFSGWNSLEDFIERYADSMDEQDGEGFVFEDSNLYHFKLKTKWYRFWKRMRGLAAKIASGSSCAALQHTEDELQRRFVEWLEKKGPDYAGTNSIVMMRNDFESEDGI